jgi:hypothetical protein
MKPIDFPASNIVIAKGQDQYMELPAHIDKEGIGGAVTSCWKLTFSERLRVLFTGRMWISSLTFFNKLQPVSLGVTVPIYRWGANTSEPETMIVAELAKEKERTLL